MTLLSMMMFGRVEDGNEMMIERVEKSDDEHGNSDDGDGSHDSY